MYINLYDSWQLASKLTLKRIINAFKIYTSFQDARKSGSPEIAGLPVSLSVEPTTACNLRCPECPSGLRSFTRPTGKLDPVLFENLINEVSETLLYLIFYFQGEPYLHPDFLKMVSYASGKKIYTATSTNAHFLTKEAARQTVTSGLNRMIISIDGSTQEVYESYRKSGYLAKVLEGTRNIINAREAMKSRTPQIVWQFLVVKPNEHQVEDIRRLAKSYKVDQVAFKTAQIYDYENGNELIPTSEKYSRYSRRDNGTYVLKHKMTDECWKMWHSCVITWDGKVVPCCFDKDGHYILGNVSESSFSEIWDSPAYRTFRESLFTSRSNMEMCNNCTEGAKVWA